MKTLLLLSILTAYVASGYAITCTTCTELTSDDPSFPVPVDPSAMTCSQNPGEMACGEGVTNCMTMTMTMHFTRDGGPLTLAQKNRDCGFANAGFLPSGNICVDEAITAIFTSTFDPTELFPAESGLTYENLDASICLCDSVDLCTPPSG